MEVVEYLEILRRQEKKTWFFRKTEDQVDKLIALEQLAKIGSPSLIRSLIPFLKADEEEFRNKTIQTIEVLFAKIKGKKAYYASLKFCQISESDIAYFESKFDIETFCLLMKIGSFNKNGYIREMAVRKLGKLKFKEGLPFIIFRLADWVPIVREVAKKQLKFFIKAEFQQELINNLSLFQWLQKVERVDLSAIYSKIVTFLVIENRTKVFTFFAKTRDKERLILARELSKEVLSNEEIDQFLEDKNFLIRLLVLKQFDNLADYQKEKLLKDNSSRVRQSTLYKFRDKVGFEELLINFIADKSGSIRHLARFYLKGESIDYKAFYIKKLQDEKDVIGSLLGLLDIEAKACDNYIKPYLENDRIRVIKTAFYVLSNLDPNKVFNFAKNHLFTHQVGLRNQIIKYFGENNNEDMLKMSRNYFSEAEEEIKLSILKLYSNIGGYSILPDLLLETINESEVIRAQAQLYVQQWKREAITLFSTPSKVEKERAMKVFHFVNQEQIQKKYFTNNPIDGLDFYIK